MCFCHKHGGSPCPVVAVADDGESREPVPVVGDGDRDDNETLNEVVEDIEPDDGVLCLSEEMLSFLRLSQIKRKLKGKGRWRGWK